MPVPADYLAARQTATDHAEAERLYAELGSPPTLAFRIWGTLAYVTGGCLWQVLKFTWVPLLVALPWLPFVSMHLVAPVLGFDLLGRFGSVAFCLILFLGVMLPIGLPALLSKNARERAAVRLALQHMFAARGPDQPGGATCCRQCGAPLTVPAGALGVRCDYCHADNLVALPPEWLATRSGVVLANHDTVTSAVEEQQRVARQSARRIRVFGVALGLGAPLAVAVGHFAKHQPPGWWASRGTPRAMLRVGDPSDRLPAGRVRMLPCGRSSADCAFFGCQCNARFWLALDSGEQVTFETSHLASAGDVIVLSTGGIAVSWKRAADGNYRVSFRAPYEGYYELRFDFEQAPRRVPLLWVPGDTPPPVHFPDGLPPPI